MESFLRCGACVSGWGEQDSKDTSFKAKFLEGHLKQDLKDMFREGRFW